MLVCLSICLSLRLYNIRFERWKVDKKQTYMKTETCKLYSRVFWIFLRDVWSFARSKSILAVSKLVRFLRHSVQLYLLPISRYEKLFTN